jgi:AraC-like DNA-binding protein
MKIQADELADILRRTELFRRYQRNFCRVTGFSVSLTDPVSPRRPPAQVASSFCRMVAHCGAVFEACRKFRGEMLRLPVRRPRTRCCFAGFSYTTVPVVAAGRTVAFLEIGPASLRQPAAERFEQVAGRPPLDRVRQNRDRLRGAWLATRTASSVQYHGIVGLLVEFGSHLGNLADRAVLHAETGEPGAVARARSFIETHSGENLHLPDVAKAAHVSAAYLSELFHKTTHCSYTDYVARLRVEKSKQLLITPESRVSEIAFEVGFQSLSQFNRVFKRITGMTPSEFRSARS